MIAPISLALALAAATGAAAPPPAQRAASPALEGKGMFVFSGWNGPPLRVFYQLPRIVTETTPVLVVIHGVERNASDYRDTWARHALDKGFIVVAPEFSRADFPDNNSFSSGGMMDKDGQVRPRDQWAFSAIDPLVDQVKAATGTRVPRYILFGHSGGAQFVQRMALFLPEAHILRAIAANAGWYTMPDFSIDFPYGLKGAPIDETALKIALARPLWLLSGSRDVDPDAPNLRRTPEAMAQGPNRLARGDAYFAAGKKAAGRLGTPFHWQRRYVNGVGHSDEGIAAAAVALIR
ncbi:MAG: alpha/beta hydrolase [Pseudomonadota bacterium]